MKKFLCYLIILIIVLFFTVNSFAFKNEPDGFRGVKWGTTIKSFKKLKKLKDLNGDVVYQRPNEKLKIGNVELLYINFKFWHGKFSEVWIHANGKSVYSDLKNIVFAKFGKGEKRNKYDFVGYQWIGKKTIMYLNYYKSVERAILIMYGSDILLEKIREREKIDAQNAKKGAKDF
jgi:hypothetical protein